MRVGVELLRRHLLAHVQSAEGLRIRLAQRRHAGALLDHRRRDLRPQRRLLDVAGEVQPHHHRQLPLAHHPRPGAHQRALALGRVEAVHHLALALVHDDFILGEHRARLDALEVREALGPGEHAGLGGLELVLRHPVGPLAVAHVLPAGHAEGFLEERIQPAPLALLDEESELVLADSPRADGPLHQVHPLPVPGRALRRRRSVRLHVGFHHCHLLHPLHEKDGRPSPAHLVAAATPQPSRAGRGSPRRVLQA
ncbi:hypothetical protein COSO111634_28630 [Corallococcus soli]